MEKLLDLKMPGLKKLGKEEQKKVEGGTTCPTFDVRANVDGLVYSTRIAAPYAGDVLKAFARDIMRFLFL